MVFPFTVNAAPVDAEPPPITVVPASKVPVVVLPVTDAFPVVLELPFTVRFAFDVVVPTVALPDCNVPVLVKPVTVAEPAFNEPVVVLPDTVADPELSVPVVVLPDTVALPCTPRALPVPAEIVTVVAAPALLNAAAAPEPVFCTVMVGSALLDVYAI